MFLTLSIITYVITFSLFYKYRKQIFDNIIKEFFNYKFIYFADIVTLFLLAISLLIPFANLIILLMILTGCNIIDMKLKNPFYKGDIDE